MPANPTSSPSKAPSKFKLKRILAVGGDKGGVGKTFTARVLFEMLRAAGVNFKPVDTDPSNPTFARFLRDKMPCAQVDIDEEGALDTLLELLDDHDVLLVDFAARAHERFSEWLNAMNFSELKTELHLELTVVFVIGDELESATILEEVAGKMAADTHFVIVLNKGKTEDFSFYGNHSVREVMHQRGAMEVVLPKLFQRTSQSIAGHRLLFSEATERRESNPLPIADQQRAKSFLRDATAAFAPAQRVLM